MPQILTSPDGTPASRIAFGAMQFGGRADASQSAAMYAPACGLAPAATGRLEEQEEDK